MKKSLWIGFFLLASAAAEAAAPPGRATGVEVLPNAEETVVRILVEGEVSYSTFSLTDPLRFTVDLENAVFPSAVASYQVDQGSVRRIRMAQYQEKPLPITRVVFDLQRPQVPEVRLQKEGLILTFLSQDAPRGPNELQELVVSTETADRERIRTGTAGKEPTGEDSSSLIVPLVPLPPAPAPPAPAPSPPDRRRAVEERVVGEADRVGAVAAKILEGARLSLVRGPIYDNTYRILSYPWGDPGWEWGSGADLVVRAFRSLEIDLQRLVHEDIDKDPEAYGISEPDPNIDHRRIRNLSTFLARNAERLPLGPDQSWLPGDLVFWRRDGATAANHLGILSDRDSSRGPRPLVIHHLEGQKPREEDVLFAWPVVEHFRWRPEVKTP